MAQSPPRGDASGLALGECSPKPAVGAASAP